MITAIDTNVLLDIVANDPGFKETSKNLLERQNNLGNLIISPIVYSELLVFFIKRYGDLAVENLNEFLSDMNIQIFEFSREDFNLAAQTWQKFNLKDIICPKCGAKNYFNCKKCKSNILWRNHLITDFLIGAHAQNYADVLLTRDIGYYKKYFKIRLLY